MARRRSYVDQWKQGSKNIAQAVRGARDAMIADIDVATGKAESSGRREFLRQYNAMGSVAQQERMPTDLRGMPVTSGSRSSLLSNLSREGYETISPAQLGTQYSGQLCMFVYDAKWKMKLPYWDAFPLVFFIKRQDSEHVLGLNLHYAPPKARAMLMDALNDRVLKNRDKRVAISYQTLQAAAKNRVFKSCIKQYLTTGSHFGRRVVVIPKEAWARYMFLPLADFRQGNASGRSIRQQVYRDSQRIF